MNAHPAVRIARIIGRRRSVPGSPARRWRRRALTLGAVGLAASGVLLTSIFASTSSAGAPGPGWAAADRDGLGIKPGKIKHVWLIILENKSFDATFTGLNNNTYLWQTLPSQGVLLKNYYGTGHFSLDNYVSLVSGQATQPDTQADCPFYDQFAGKVDTSGSLATNPNYGQLVSAAGPNAEAGTNGCVYPASVPTLFNQLDAAKVGWKGYAQDLGNADTSGPVHDAGAQFCGAPYASRPPPTGRAPRRQTRAARTRPTSTCPSTSRSRGSTRCCSRGTAMPRISPTCSIHPTVSTTTCRAKRRRRPSAGSRRTTAATLTMPSAPATT